MKTSVLARTSAFDLHRGASPARPERGLPTIAAVDVGKCYHLYGQQQDRLKQLLWGGNRRFYRETWALRHVDLEVSQGRAVGLVGANGSGKSTFLQLVAGTVTPSEGRIDVRGRVAALLELGSGFNPEFTGRDNVYLNASILGLSHDEITERFDDVAAFADIGSYLDCPVKTYSSGMLVRLAFSVAISVDPDVLLIDEALAVGDFRFQQRCLARIRQLRDQGVTLVFVTHDLDAAKRLCDDLYVLDQGRLIRSGQAPHVANWYLSHLTRAESRPVFTEEEPAGHSTEGAAFQLFRHGIGGGRITKVEWQELDGVATSAPVMDQTYRLHVEMAFTEDFDQPVLGFYVRDRLGTDLIGVNTHQEGRHLASVRAGDVVTVDFVMPLRLRPGRYGISCAVAPRPDDLCFLDWIDNAVVFDLIDPEPQRVVFGLTHPEVHVEISSTTPVL